MTEPKRADYIELKDWTARRPDGQRDLISGADPVPPVKSSNRPGLGRIEARIPAEKAHAFKWKCKLLQVEIKDVIEQLIDHWLDVQTGRPDGQTAMIDQIDPEKMMEITQVNLASSDQMIGRLDGQTARLRDILAYYALLTGNPISPGDRQFAETLLAHPSEIIKAGIALSIARKPEIRIRSIRYFQGAIEELLEGPPILFSQYLAHLERALVRVGRLTPLQPVPEPAKQPDLPHTSGELITLEAKNKS